MIYVIESFIINYEKVFCRCLFFCMVSYLVSFSKQTKKKDNVSHGYYDAKLSFVQNKDCIY